MNREEVEQIMQLPLDELAKVASTPEGLARVLSLAIQMGIRIGQRQICDNYNSMFKGYNEISISN